MRASFNLYPWDVAPGAEALVDAGVERVALAAVYHAGRVATPRHPDHRIRYLDTSASYLAAATALPRGDASFERARDALLDAEIAVDTWVVLAHVDGAAPELPRVRDAWGTEVRHALCLSSPDVRAALLGLVDAALDAAAGDLVVEAAGWQGVGHGDLHDKTTAAGLDLDVLSWCCCDGCTTALGQPDLAARVREGRLDEELRARVDDGRRTIARGLLMEIAERADAAGVRLVAYPGAEPGVADVLLADAWDTAAPAPEAEAAYVTLLDGKDPAPFWRRLRDGGVQELLIYHAGLVSADRLAAATAALKGLR